MLFTHDISAILFQVGPLEVRWYGVLFATGLGLNYWLLTWIFKREKYDQKLLDSLVIWLFFGLVIGARLGHIVFYEIDYYLANPLQILQIWRGGLASHGAAIGLAIAYFGWCRRHKVNFSKYINAIVVPMPLTAGFVRLGNFFNSEIVGYPTGGDYGVIFARLGEDFARHPVQLYSMLMNWLVFAILFWVYKKKYKKMPPLSIMFLYLLLQFVGRFIVEFWKELHGPLPVGFPLAMGQLLSTIPIAIALIYFARLLWKKR